MEGSRNEKGWGFYIYTVEHTVFLWAFYYCYDIGYFLFCLHTAGVSMPIPGRLNFKLSKPSRNLCMELAGLTSFASRKQRCLIRKKVFESINKLIKKISSSNM